MKLIKRTPIAWLQLSHRPLRLAAALAGVGFANVLVFFQLGLSGGLYDSQKRPIQQFNGSLAVIPRRYTNFGEPAGFPRSRLSQVLGVQGVRGVTPLRLGKLQWLNPETQESTQALLMGVDPGNPALKLPELTAQRSSLQLQGGVLFDKASKTSAGPVTARLEQGQPFNTELNGQRTTVNGLFQLGLTFAADINLITSTSNFQTLFPDRDPDEIQIGVVQLQSGAEANAVQNRLNKVLGPSLQVLTVEELQQREVEHWKRNTSFGLIFGLGVLVGFSVGGIVVYQILYSEVGEHISEYATMKAMGYNDRFIVAIIIQESVILASLAFLPSLIVSALLYRVLMQATGLLVVISFSRAALVFTMTLLLCSGSGWLATAKLRRLDPADVF
ncbi:ABC transporter permease DevC [Synechococcus sp. UW179A]|uniref:ABC transporter permease DevC n=1 Tax=Synechococcus sp. UW179A TaxID=2575510 RepID=UPI000E0E5855|nr:ABC transporter permease DevC [Synechococcus sp. UW179A]